MAIEDLPASRHRFFLINFLYNQSLDSFLKSSKVLFVCLFCYRGKKPLNGEARG